jgi:hypothetical protein
MRFLRPALSAVLLISALVLALPSAAQSYVIHGNYREWQDASGNIIGWILKPCGTAPIQSWGVTVGLPTRFWSLDCGMINQVGGGDAPYRTCNYTVYDGPPLLPDYVLVIASCSDFMTESWYLP